MNAYIKAISYYLPEKVFSNQEIIDRFPEWSADKITKKIGIANRHIAASTETAGDMAIKSGQKLFLENSINKDEIDFVLLCTQSPDYFLPTTACLIQDKLGLSTNCGALDFNLGCSGYIYGLALAKGLICANIAKNILLITAETYSKHIHQDDKKNLSIFGDAAAATLVSNEGFAEILDFNLGTDGSGAENLIVKNGGFRKSIIGEKESPDKDGNFNNPNYLFMDGAEIFNFTSDAVPKLVNENCQKNNLVKDDIDLFIFHQANKYMIDYLRKLILIDKNKFYTYIEDVGNTVSSTIPIALKEARSEGRLTGKVLLAGFGVGYSYGSVILNINK